MGISCQAAVQQVRLIFFSSYLTLIQTIFRMQGPAVFSTIFRMQEAGEVTDQPSTSQQGARGVLSHQGARSVIDQQEEEEEEEEWESVARPLFTYQSPYVLEKLKRVKEAAM